MSKRKHLKKTKTKVIYVRVDPDDHAQIETLAERSGLPLAEFARLALTRPLKRRRHKAAA
jgi:predicted HicB family RNase H-like nuclease